MESGHYLFTVITIFGPPPRKVKLPMKVRLDRMKSISNLRESELRRKLDESSDPDVTATGIHRVIRAALPTS